MEHAIPARTRRHILWELPGAGEKEGEPSMGIVALGG